jgi:ATP-dependent RNA helicase DDX5/DBP2
LGGGFADSEIVFILYFFLSQINQPISRARESQMDAVDDHAAAKAARKAAKLARHAAEGDAAPRVRTRSFETANPPSVSPEDEAAEKSARKARKAARRAAEAAAAEVAAAPPPASTTGRASPALVAAAPARMRTRSFDVSAEAERTVEAAAERVVAAKKRRRSGEGDELGVVGGGGGAAGGVAVGIAVKRGVGAGGAVGGGADAGAGTGAGAGGSRLSTAEFCVKHSVRIVSASGFACPPPMEQFSATPFPPKLVALFAAAGYTAPTVTQALAWPIALTGVNLVSVAKTGSGKTLGFLMPVFSALAARAPAAARAPPALLVMAPTRELACQIEVEATKFGRAVGLRAACVYGGAPKSTQIRALRDGVDCIIGTPGRLQDLMTMGVLSLAGVKYLVLDEADRMLDMGFEESIRAIIAKISPARQTLLFTATWPRAVQRLAAEFAPNPVQVSLGDTDVLAANVSITQVVEVVSGNDAKAEKLRALIRQLHMADGVVKSDHGKTIVFVKFKASCNRVAQDLWDAGFAVNTLHGDMEQRERTQVIGDFRTGKLRIIVATDVAARGLDVKVRCARLGGSRPEKGRVWRGGGGGTAVRPSHDFAKTLSN